MRAEPNWRVGLIGFGLGGAAFHAPVIAATPGLVIAAIVTSNASRREQAVRMYPAARVFANAAEMFASATDLDIAVIASPNRTTFRWPSMLWLPAFTWLWTSPLPPRSLTP